MFKVKNENIGRISLTPFCCLYTLDDLQNNQKNTLYRHVFSRISKAE